MSLQVGRSMEMLVSAAIHIYRVLLPIFVGGDISSQIISENLIALTKRKD
jgi:hypothetical protein